MELNLELGRLSEIRNQRVPIHLCGQGLAAHTAIIAQSGSGKSFFLGRLLEEILSKTRGRALILDPNSDFVKFNKVDEGVFENANFEGEFCPGEKQEFCARWQQIHFSILLKKELMDLGTPSENSLISPISISWPTIGFQEQVKLLDLSLLTMPAEWAVFQLIEHLLDPPIRTPLQGWQEIARALWEMKIKGTPNAQPCTGWTSTDLRKVGLDNVSAEAALAVNGRLLHLLNLGIWDHEPPARSLESCVQKLTQHKSNSKVVCLEIGSLDNPEQRHIVAAVALNVLWEQAKSSWVHAMENDRSLDSRCPVFIVIDEAHNLAPAESSSESVRTVTDILIRIAMEGRKYGLFLILVTQRPSRLNSSLISQCDNLCLMKMSNYADLQLVESSFGFLPHDWARRAMDFGVGEALLAGRFVDSPLFAKGAPRRTVEGGRSLPKDYWLQDPFPMGAHRS